MSAEKMGWPGPGPEPWWWEHCSPRMRERYAKTQAPKKNGTLARLLQDEGLRQNRRHWERREQELGPRRRYVRFGELPPGGRSARWVFEVAAPGEAPDYTGNLEAGVSCFAAYEVPEGYVIDLYGDPLPRMVPHGLSYKYLMRARAAFLVRSRPLGPGTDGEPLLDDVEVIREIDKGRLIPCRVWLRGEDHLLRVGREPEEGAGPGWWESLGELQLGFARATKPLERLEKWAARMERLAEGSTPGPSAGARETLENQVRETLRKWGVPDEEHARAMKMAGFGSLLKGGRWK